MDNILHEEWQLRIAQFCNATCRKDYLAVLAYVESAPNTLFATPEIAKAALKVIEQFRKQHKRCLFCAEKLSKARQHTIG